MSRFLIDANLPYYFSLWKSEKFIHVKDLNESWSDSKIWSYAKEKNLIILTKDADFSIRVMTLGPPPKVIHFKTGNQRIADFYNLVFKNWDEILLAIQNSALVNIYPTHIESIS